MTAIINFYKNGRNSRFFEDTIDWKINTEFPDSVMKLDHKKVLGVAMAKEILQSQGKSLFQVGFSERERGRNISCPFLCVDS